MTMDQLTVPKKKGKKPELTPEQKAERARKLGAERLDRFRRIAPRRMAAAVKTIGYLVALANRQSYAYTDEQAERLITDLESAVEKVKMAFMSPAKATAKYEFRL